MRALASNLKKALVLTVGLPFIGACAVTLERQEGNRLSMLASSALWPDAESAGWLQLDDGREILISQADIVWARFRLIPCEAQAQGPKTWSWVKAARAHVDGDPLRFEGALEESALGVLTETTLATLYIPDGRYCEISVGADRGEDGFSLRIEGTTRLPGEPWQPFYFEETAAFNLSFALSDVDVKDGRKLRFEVQKDPKRWFEAVTFEAHAERDDARALLRAISASSQVVLK